MSPWTALSLVGVSVLVVGWLLVVFLRPSPARAVIEWVATTAMYLALGSWFLHLSLDAWGEGRMALLIPFGFLAFLFCAGFCVSLYRTGAQAAGRVGAGQSATH